jgi:HK97 family phage major capsid protein
MELEDVKKLLQAQGEAWEAFKQAHTEEAKELKRLGSVTVETQDKMGKINAALDELTVKIEQAEKAFARPQRGQHGADDAAKIATRLANANAHLQSFAAGKNLRTKDFEDIEQVDQHNKAFVQWARTGRADGIESMIRQDMIVGVDGDGGYLVPADMTGRIATRIYDLSPIRQIATVQATTSSELEGIVDNGDMDAGWTAETGTRTDTTTATIGKYSISTEEMYAMPKISTKLIQDAAVNLEAWLTAKIADRMARLEGAAFISGDGVNKPRGFATYTTAATADASRAWGTLEHVNTGANGAFGASNPADVLIDVVEAMKAGYRANARWVTRRSVVALIRKFKEATTNAYLWQPGLTAGQPATLLGFPVTMAEDMPALGTGSLSMAFGNFSEGYMVADRLGMSILRDPFTSKGYVKFYTTARVGGGVVNSEVIKFVRFAS